MDPRARSYLSALEQAGKGPRPFDAALALAVEHFRTETGTIHVLKNGALELVAHVADLPPAVLEQIRVIPVGKGMAGLAVLRKEPVTACNLQTDASGDVRPGARATGMQGSIVVPLMRGESAVGALGVANRSERVFDEAERELLLATGRVVAGWV